MSAERIIAMGLPELRAALDSGALTSADLVAAYRQRIASVDRPAGGTRAVLAVNGAALEQARAWDAKQRARQGAAARNASLAGIPFLAKDNFDAVGMPNTGGSLVQRMDFLVHLP